MMDNSVVVEVPPKVVLAKGKVMTAAEVHAAMARVDGGVVGISLGFGTFAGFDSYMAAQQLFRLADRWLITSDYVNYDHARCDDEVVLRDVPHTYYRCTPQALADIPADDTPVYLGFPRRGTRSRLGRHFMVPLAIAGPAVFTSFGDGDEKKYRVEVGVLSLWGEI